MDPRKDQDASSAGPDKPVEPETPLASGLRHLARAMEAVKAGGDVRLYLNPEEHAALMSPDKYDAIATPFHEADHETVRRLLAGESVRGIAPQSA